MIEAFGLDGDDWKDTIEARKKYVAKDTSSLLQWAEERSLLYSTVFIRQLCLFMLSNPQWFSNFTGEPKYRFSGSEDVGIG